MYPSARAVVDEDGIVPSEDGDREVRHGEGRGPRRIREAGELVGEPSDRAAVRERYVVRRLGDEPLDRRERIHSGERSRERVLDPSVGVDAELRLGRAADERDRSRGVGNRE